jgi:hypothetical protein
MKGVFPCSWLLGLAVPVQEIFVQPWLLLSAQYKIFISPHCTVYTFSVPLSPWPSKLGRQSCWVAGLLLSVSGMNRALERKSKQVTETSPCFIHQLVSSYFSIYWRPFIILLSFRPWGCFFMRNFPTMRGRIVH